MKNGVRKMVMLAMAMCVLLGVQAQDKLQVNGNVGFVSNYVWRGLDQNAGFSLQPSLSLGYKGFALSAWGSQSLTNNKDRDVQEFDINASYSFKGLTLMISDLWWGGLHSPYGYYGEGPAYSPLDGGHHFEATVSYRISQQLPLTFSWSTWFAGADAKTSDGDRCYSTYLNLSYPVSCWGGVVLTPAVGFTPWKGYYHNKAAFTDLSLQASKEIELSSRFSLPIFVQTIVSPTQDHVYLVGGFALGF